MLISMTGPTGRVEKIRDEDIVHYENLGYKRVPESETVELMSPAGKVVVARKDVEECLRQEGWSSLENSIPEPEPDQDDDTKAAEGETGSESKDSEPEGSEPKDSEPEGSNSEVYDDETEAIEARIE